MSVSLLSRLQARLPIQACKEIFLASSGLKVSRVCLQPDQAEYLANLAEEFEFFLAASSRRVEHRKDLGKGGWSNSVLEVHPIDGTTGDFELFVATEQGLAESACEYEAKGDDDKFGRLLGIPECCRIRYLEWQSVAARKQNDFVPLIAKATVWDPPFEPMNNILAQYFGYSLLSHFPCSFDCRFSSKLSSKFYNFLFSEKPSIADLFMKHQHSNVLYSEYSGIIELPGTRVKM